MHVTRVDNSSGFIDLYWPGVLLVEQKGAGRDLEAARVQPGIYFDALPAWDRPRYQLLCDFRAFELLDRDGRAETRFTFADLTQHVEKFGFNVGLQFRTFRDQGPVSIEALGLVARLLDALKAWHPRCGRRSVVVLGAECVLPVCRRHRDLRAAGDLPAVR